MRGSVVSNHGAPASSSRTDTRRVASSVSPSQSNTDGPGAARVAMTMKAVAMRAHASGVAAQRLSVGQRGSTCCKASIDIAAYPGELAARAYASGLRRS